jgi:uncharacterized protein YecE (DUF72 family)
MMLKNHKHFYAGTSNVVLPVPNKAFFPEAYRDKSRLHYYASLFNSVEINSSFYKIPMSRTVAKWAADVPDGFRFTFKLWKGITHVGGLAYRQEDLYPFLEAIAPAADKKGCLLLQFPASLTAVHFAQLAKLLADVEQANRQYWPLALEFRHHSWYSDKVYRLLEKHEATIVTHDMPASSTPDVGLDTKNRYLRFHGERGKYGGSYDDYFLHEYAGYIKTWLREKKVVYVYFNNTMGSAVQNLITLNSM